uniref:Rieske domain-containing protein n=1 Tax=Florenciella parvula TaxID=236787 RepID=A0A7S2FV96_9STRA|mmetsp:Transcript_25007/g.51722  ORF Transcript_25007/g.51722 Transcript_25007/m.51722 type:complete len:192 (+) Transcript_25007:27-602(+)|eukprot:CAMPEP_0182555746 /NCGR_PEP_ID=MMETSP1324-20130603/229_1 /TAXON_ID=236786 /ORGANISM="Florenciella sp., Strain RCC1587" /LENGTH=191 /DNA_ID=CAMNT_0024767527 /DNA_START=43 /DNA_END=618 /DNA_ORIENTATION=+
MKFASVLVALACAMSVSAFAPTAPLRALTTRSVDSKVTMMAGKSASKLKYVNAIPLSDLPKPGGAVGAVVGGLDVCIAVGTDGLIYALGGKAPPTGTPLKDGKVGKKTIKDAQYGTEFNLENGQVEGKWCPGGIGFIVGKLVSAEGVPTYKVKKSGAFIQVEVDVAYKQNYESNYWRGILDAQGKTDGGYY